MLPTMTKALVLALALSTLFAVIFAGGGAGIYGSPFPGRDIATTGLWLATILVAPVACLAALLVCRRSRLLASILLLSGAMGGAYFGSLTVFRDLWEWIFLIFVWAPMAVVAVCLWIPRSLPSEPADPSASKATISLCLGAFALLACLTPVFSVPTAIAGIVLGLTADSPRRKWAAVAGIVLSIISLAIGATLIGLWIVRFMNGERIPHRAG